MKNLYRFRSWDATMFAVLLFTMAVLPVCSQTTPAIKPGGMVDMDAEKVRSTSVTVSLGDKTFTLDAAALAAMPHETVTVVNGHTKASETYTGVPVAALLIRLGLPFQKANEHTLLRTYLLAEGTDGYKVLVSTYETLAAIREKSAIVADSVEGKPLDKDGAFKLVIPGDTRPQRWVQNLKSLSFRTTE